VNTAPPITQQRQHGLQADSLGFLVGQRRLERTASNIHQDTQEMVRLLKGMMQHRVLNPPDNQVQGLAAAIAMAQRRPTIEIVNAIRELRTTDSIPPIAMRPTRDIGGANSPRADLLPIPPLSTRPTLDVRSHNDLPRRDVQPITEASTATLNAPTPTPTPTAAPTPTPTAASNTSATVADTAVIPNAVPQHTDVLPRGTNGRSEGGGDSKPWFDKFKNAVSGGVSTGMADTQGVDPTVDAINELSGLMSPVKKAAGFAFKPISMLMKRNKRSEPLPADQERHNREERKFWGRLVDAVRAQGNGNANWAAKLGGLVIAGAMAALRRIPWVAAGILAWEAGQAAGGKVNEALEGTTVGDAIGELSTVVAAAAGSQEAIDALNTVPEGQSATNGDGSSNVGKMGAWNRFGNWVGRTLVQKPLNWVNEALGGSPDYFTDSSATGAGGQAAVDSNSRLGAFAGVADAVGFGEGDYNSVNRGADPRTGKSYGSTKANLSEMTINQVLARNKKPFGDPDRMNAVGKYQIIASTMKGLVSKMGLTGEEKLTPEMQDRLFMALMPKATTDYVSGRSTDRNTAITGLAKEYASIGVPVDMKGHVQNVRAGQSFYQGYGGNKANPQSLSKVAAALDGARAQTVGKPTQPATPAKLPDTSQGLAEYAEIQPAPAVTVPVPAPIPASNTQSMIRPAAQVMSLPISASSIRQAPNLPVPQPMPKVREQISSPAPQVVTIAQSADNISQNVGDRAIAHAVTGGLGMRGWEQG